MKATLTFDLPEESVEHADAVHGADWKSLVWDLDERLRGYLKHGHQFTTPDQLIECVRTFIRDYMVDRGITFDG